ncbi:MAG: hypothetical protein QXR96_01020 [Candidatus Woesearchaeota archaeon]
MFGQYYNSQYLDYKDFKPDHDKELHRKIRYGLNYIIKGKHEGPNLVDLIYYLSISYFDVEKSKVGTEHASYFFANIILGQRFSGNFEIEYDFGYKGKAILSFSKDGSVKIMNKTGVELNPYLEKIFEILNNYVTQKDSRKKPRYKAIMKVKERLEEYLK